MKAYLAHRLRSIADRLHPLPAAEPRIDKMTIAIGAQVDESFGLVLDAATERAKVLEVAIDRLTAKMKALSGVAKVAVPATWSVRMAAKPKAKPRKRKA